MIPGLGRSAGEWIGYPLQYSWASLVVQVVKNLPAMQETSVQFLGWEGPLEKGQATHSSILGLPLVKNAPALQADSLPTELSGKPQFILVNIL